MFGRGAVLQAEAAECGLACLATVAAHHGRNESLGELRRRFPMSLAGTSLRSLIGLADSLGFSARAVRCDLDEIGQLELPAILHWDLDHYVVLRRVRRDYAMIADPAVGERKLLLKDVSRHFTGVALELTPTPHFEKKVQVERVRLHDLWTRLTGFRPFLVQLLLLTLVLQTIGLFTPLASQLVVDDVIGRADRDLLTAILFGFSALILIQGAITALRGFIQLHAGQRMSIQLSGNLLRHLLRLPSEFFERRHVGDVLSRFGSLTPAQTFLTSGLVGVALDAIMVLPVAVVMTLYSPLLAAIVAVNLLVIFVVRATSFPTARRFAEEALNLGAKVDSVFLETVRSARAIKIAAKETERHGLWQNSVAEQQNAAYRQGAFNLWGATGLGVLTGIHGLVLLYFGALQVISGAMTLGMLFAFQAYAMQFTARLNGLIGAYFTFRMLGLHLERLADIVHGDVERGLDDAPLLARPLRGSITFQGLRFRYGQHDPWVLDGASAAIEAGQSVAIVGPSGGGKSTLMKLLIGIYEPVEGEVLFDGLPMRALGLRALRESIGVVMQDDQLLSGTIADNVSFFDAKIDMERIERACRLAHVHDDVIRMPMGYHSLVGDMGSILSGGQKQRLLLARALYKEPVMLFMDEGTANLDPALESKVMTSLDNLKITRVMVAHRQSAIQGADRVLVIEQGRVSDASNAGSPSSIAVANDGNAG